MIDPPRWTAERLDADRLRSISDFRKERLEEPVEDYLRVFDDYRERVEKLLGATDDLTALDEGEFEALSRPELLEAFRYLAGPPISSDDLKVLADAPSLAAAAIRRDEGLARRLIDIVRAVVDRRRFVWVVENRKPTEAERAAAVTASAALMAVSRVQTNRRGAGKDRQEGLLKKALADRGLVEVAARGIPNLTAAPAAGEFCGESLLGSRKADVVVRLWDERIMPIECKVSNSSTNSVKRLNNDAAAKAVAWRIDFGRRQVVPAALLSGVFKPHNLEEAQDRGLALFWAHDLKALIDWIERTGDPRGNP